MGFLFRRRKTGFLTTRNPYFLAFFILISIFAVAISLNSYLNNEVPPFENLISFTGFPQNVEFDDEQDPETVMFQLQGSDKTYTYDDGLPNFQQVFETNKHWI